MICQTKSEIRRAKEGTPGSLFIPEECGYIGELGDDIEIQGSDPDFPGLARRWRGKITSKTPEGITIEGRFWIGNAAALETLRSGA